MTKRIDPAAMYAAYHQWALDDGARQPVAVRWALRHWLVRLAALAFCAGAFWLVAFLVFGKATAFWVAAFAATGLFPAVLGLRWRDRQAEAGHGAVHHGADRAHHP